MCPVIAQLRPHGDPVCNGSGGDSSGTGAPPNCAVDPCVQEAMRVAIPVCLLFGLAAFASAQNARRPSFEVASVKLNLTGSGNTNTNGDPGLLVITNLTLDRLIQMAFRVSPAEISGPDWLNSVRVDIAAKYPAGSTHEDRGGMMEIENQTGIDGNFSRQRSDRRAERERTGVRCRCTGESGARARQLRRCATQWR